jgi:hydrogenase nickel incorporation protein HypA/HybF
MGVSCMHELSLCRQIIKQVEKSISIEKKVITVNILVGKISSVDCESLTFWFPTVAKSSRLASAKMIVETCDAKARCEQCDNVFHIDERYCPCPKCSSYHHQLLSGDELFIQSVEVV